MSSQEILRFVLGDVFIPMKGIRPLSDAELGRMARTLVPMLARKIQQLEDLQQAKADFHRACADEDLANRSRRKHSKLV